MRFRKEKKKHPVLSLLILPARIRTDWRARMLFQKLFFFLRVANVVFRPRTTQFLSVRNWRRSRIVCPRTNHRGFSRFSSKIERPKTICEIFRSRRVNNIVLYVSRVEISNISRWKRRDLFFERTDGRRFILCTATYLVYIVSIRHFDAVI